MTTGIGERKAAARKAAFAARKAAFAQPGLAERAGARLAEYVATRTPRIVAAYMPIRTEVSPLGVMADLAAGGLRICVPVIEGAGLPLKFREWTPDAAMVEGPFGAAVPAEGDWLDPDHIIAPLVAFDSRGYRLGYGGGFYDRSIAGLRARGIDPFVIGFAFAAQRLDTVPTEPTDVRLDAIVTEDGVLEF